MVQHERATNKTSPTLTTDDALVVVDVQRDFCPGGALAVDDGDAVVPILNDWIASAKAGGAMIVASRDWHPPNHISFRERAGLWPAHCIQQTVGAEFHPDLSIPNDRALVIAKGTDPNIDQYSAFDRTGLVEVMRDHGVRRVWIGGLALDVCVRATALDAVRAGFETYLIRDATRAVDSDQAGEVLAALQDAGVIIQGSSST